MCNCGKNRTAAPKYSMPARARNRDSRLKPQEQSKCEYVVRSSSGEQRYPDGRAGELRALDYASRSGGVITQDCQK